MDGGLRPPTGSYTYPVADLWDKPPRRTQRLLVVAPSSSLHTAAQLSSQFFAPGSSSRTWNVGMAATMSAMALRKALYRNGAREACRPPYDDPVIVRWMRLCVSLGSVCENGVIVYVDYIFDCSGPIVRIDKPILHLDAYGRRHLSPPDPFAICWLALTVAGASTSYLCRSVFDLCRFCDTCRLRHRHKSVRRHMSPPG